MQRRKRRTKESSQVTPRDRGRRVFLDIPYQRSFRNYERAIVTTLLTYGLHPVIAKESKKTALILDEVCSLIKSAKYAVVDISGLNFNVAFEAGFLHALGERKFILLKNKITKVPSDLQGLKYNEYSSSNTLTKALTGWLKQSVPEARLSPHASSIAKVIRRIKKDASVSEATAKDMLLVIVEELAEADRKLPFN